MRVRCVPILIAAFAAPSAAQVLFADVRKEHRFEVAATEQLFPADLDGDGRLDVAVRWGCCRNYQWPRHYAWRNLGGGRFAPVPLGSIADFALAAHDMDGDGDGDLVMSQGVAVNDGRGRFTFAGVPWPGFLWENRVAVADVDLDGDADVFGNGRLLLQSSVLQFVERSGSLPPLPPSPLIPAFADVDGDGDPDLVAGSRYEPARLLLNDGTGVFVDVTATHLPVTVGRTEDVVIADVDRDGDQDVLLANWGTSPGLLLNRGNGTFADGGTRLAAVPPGNTRSIAAGDVDGDGDVDLVLGEDDGGRLLENGAGTYTVAPAGRWPTDPLQIADVLLVDLDGDRDLDLLEARNGPGYGAEARVAFNDGYGRFLPGIDEPVPAPITNGRAVLGDLDRDGALDLLVTDGTALLLSGTGRGTFQAPIDLGVSARGLPRLADIDADGDLDAIVVEDTRLRVLRNPGDGRLALLRTLQLVLQGTQPRATDAVLADFDRDGVIDIFVTTVDQLPIGVLGGILDLTFRGDGRGGFTPVPWLPWMPTAALAAATGDMDGDGFLDVVVSGSLVYLWRPGLGFAALTSPTFSYGRTTSVALGDLDGDGDLDVVDGRMDIAWGTEPKGPEQRVFWNDGRGTLWPAAKLPGTWFTQTFATALVDAELDGDLDIVLGQEGGNSPQDLLLLNDGRGGFTEVVGWPPSGVFPEDFDNARAILPGDLDGDGDTDLVMVNDSFQVFPMPVPVPASRVYLSLARHLTTPDLARLAQPYRLRADGAPGGAALLLAAGPGSLATPWGRFGLSPATTVFAGALPPSITGASNVLALRIPAVPALAGNTLWWQAAVASASGVRLTNAVADVVFAH